MADRKRDLYLPSAIINPRLSAEVLSGVDLEGYRPVGDPYFKVPFRGGAVTSVAKALLEIGAYSMVQNMRGKHPGFEKRMGQAKLHATALTSTPKVVSLYQFVKDRVTETHFFAQTSLGDVWDAANDPPIVSGTTFAASEVYSGTAGTVPASWSNIKDMMLYSNGLDQHQIYAGTSSYVQKFIKHISGVSVLRTPKIGVDYSIEVSDGKTTTKAVLDAIGTLEAFDCVFIKTPVPAKSFSFVISEANSETATMAIKYWKSNSTWAPLTIGTDGTIDSGATLAVDGTITFTEPTDIVPRYLYGQNGFWYQVHFLATLTNPTSVSSVTFDSSWQDIVNVWDGVTSDAIEIQYYDHDAADPVYYTYGSSAAEIDSMTTSDKVYFSSADPIDGIYIDVGVTPNTGTQTSVNGLYYWDGDSFEAVSGLTDGTTGLANSGWIFFDREASEQTQFLDLPYKAYWYYFTVAATISDDVIIGIQTKPYFDIEDFGKKGRTNASWKNRTCLTFDQFGEYIYVSTEGNPLALNGEDYGILRPGDGRSNRVVAMRNFQNELMVWQKEIGVEGGCLTLYEGYSPQTWGKLLLSSRIGAMNNKSVVVIDGVNTTLGASQGTQEKTLAFWISRYGVCVSDGKNVSIISEPISNYFDPRETADCIQAGKEDEHWLGYDSTDKVLRLGLVTGPTDAFPNVFPVYDLIDGRWYFDKLAQGLACMTEVQGETATNKLPVIQVGGGIADGFVYRLNTGTNDVSTAIDAYIQMELNGDGEFLLLRELIVRAKAQAGNLDITITKNALTGSSKTVTTVAKTTGELIRRHRINFNVMGQLISIKFQSDAAAELLELYDLALKLFIVEER